MDTIIKPLSDAELAEVKRLVAAAESEIGTQRDLAVAMNNTYLAFPAILARLEAAERERDTYHAALSDIYYRAIPMNEDSGHSTIAHIASDAMLGKNSNPLAARDAKQRREGAAEVWGQIASIGRQVTDQFIHLTAEYAEEQAKRLREGGE